MEGFDRISRCGVLFGGGMTTLPPLRALAVCFFILFMASAEIVLAQSANMETVSSLIQSGNFRQAEEMLTILLKSEPTNGDALLIRANLRAWQGRFAQAEEDFLAVLKLQPDKVQAITDLGYTYAWWNKFDKALAVFRKALQLDPKNKAARMGLGYVAFWQGNYESAIQRFSELSRQFPDDAEIAEALAQAYFAARYQGRARKALNRALRLNPGKQSLTDMLSSLSDMPPLFELSIWGGYTDIQSEQKLGLRFAEVGYWPSSQTRLWMKYDNTLSLDNPVLLRENQLAPTYLVGALSTFSNKATLKLEGGVRDLPGSSSQSLFLVESVFYFAPQAILKLGGFWTSRSDGRKDLNLMMGLGTTLNSRFFFEPLFYYTNSRDSDEKEWRTALNAEYRITSRWRVLLGAATGKVISNIPAADGNLWSAHALITAPLGARHWVFALARRESLPLQKYSVFSLGIKFRIERN